MPNRMTDRLPDLYKKEESNIDKLNQVFVDEIDELNSATTKVKSWLDIDQKEGEALDDLGINLQVQRNGMDDENYRLMLKIKIISNMSDGDIPTLNQVIPVLTNGEFKGIKQGFLFDNDPFPKEPAAFLIRMIASLDKDNRIPFNAVEKITAGGVKAYWELIFSDLIKIQTEYSKNEIGWYIQPKANTFAANEMANQMSYIYPFFLKTQSEYKTKEEIWELYLSNLKYESFFNYSDQRVTLSGGIKANQNANQMSYIYPDGFKFETSYNLAEQVWSFYPSDMKIETKYLGSKQKLVKAKTIKAGQEVLYN